MLDSSIMILNNIVNLIEVHAGNDTQLTANVNMGS